MDVVTALKIEQTGPDRLSSLSGRAESKFGTLAHCCYSLGGMVIFTWAAFHLNLNLASTGFLYLILVVLTAVYGGFLEATVTSLAAATCLNFFFDPPIFTFSVSDSANWVAFGAFEFTALVISRLTSREHVTAAKAFDIPEKSDRADIHLLLRRVSQSSSHQGTAHFCSTLRYCANRDLAAPDGLL